MGFSLQISKKTLDKMDLFWILRHCFGREKSDKDVQQNYTLQVFGVRGKPSLILTYIDTINSLVQIGRCCDVQISMVKAACQIYPQANEVWPLNTPKIPK